MPERKDHDTGSILDAHFFQDSRPIPFDGSFTQVELVSDLLGGMLPADKANDLFFPIGKEVFESLSLHIEFTCSTLILPEKVIL